MQLSDTLTRRRQELPPGPIRMYFCGPTVYQRAHVGNARPFVLGMWLRNWLRLRGHDVTLVHNITDINDRIYEAAPGASAELALRATEWYLEDTGGLDLVFPHHENELAQSRALGHDFARIWTHNGLLRFTGAKMSKSEGNIVTIRDALERWGRETLLVFFLTGHWSKPIDFSDETMAAAAARVEGFREVFRSPSEPAAPGEWERFEAALEDDFNTPDALAVMHGWRDHELLRRALDLFGLGSLAEEEAAPDELHGLARKRAEVRAVGDFDESDRLRREIEDAGWEVRDVAGEPGYQLVPKR